MQKIGHTLLREMIDKHLSNLEIRFLLLIARVQDDHGNVTGVYYRDVCEKLSCSETHFYNVLRSLADKGIITWTKASYFDYDITILDNDFSSDERYRQGYLSLDKGLFNDAFDKLKAGAKLIAMELFLRQSALYARTRGQSRSYSLKKDTFYKKFMEMLSVSRRVLHDYLESLKGLFSIGEKDGKLYVTPTKDTCSDKSLEDPKELSGNQRYDQHDVRTLCRRNRIAANGCSDDAVSDVAKLFSQYADKARMAGMDIRETVRESILRSVDKNETTFRAKERFLDNRLVHRILKDKIAQKKRTLENSPEKMMELQAIAEALEKDEDDAWERFENTQSLIYGV